MKSYDYTKEQLVSALKDVGLKAGDVVFSHSNIGFLGLPEGAENITDICKLIVLAFMDVIGSKGTLVVPTFTYSFCKNKTFDRLNTPSDCGAFSQYILEHEDAVRSNDPCVSVAAIGYLAEQLVSDVSQNTYDQDGFFARFYQKKGVICNLNFDAGSTFLHYVERNLKVPYRFDKTFDGLTMINGKLKASRSTIWVRKLEEGTEANFEYFNELAVKHSKYKVQKIGKGFVGLISSGDCYQLIATHIKTVPWMLTKNIDLHRV